MEWTHEGGEKGLMFRVMPDGISARYQGKTYDSTFTKSGCTQCINLGGTTEVQAFVLFQGKSFFYFTI